jgi:hypothetical protein
MQIIAIESGGVTFSDGTTIQDLHDQDCCEHVFAQWSDLENTAIVDTEIAEIVIEKVEDSGFRLNGHFVGCYDHQNGYYSSDLALCITRPNGNQETIDISSCVVHE